jgi:predicted nucleic acid-binding Zn ribbon protein
MNKSEAGKLGSIASRAAHKAAYDKRVYEYYSNPTRCKFCNSVLPYKHRKNKFCNQSCSASFNNAKRQAKYKICLNCGDKIPTYKKFCSNKCQMEYQHKKRVKEWKKDSSKTGAFIKSYLMRKYNYKCCKCGWGEVNPKTKKIPLEVHHIDGNWKNNEESNLELLCPNCHSLTPTFKASNKGKGRTLNP